MNATETNVWELAANTGQSLEVVIFQAVAYKAWNEGGHIDGHWAAALTGVLNSHHPWRRQTPRHQSGAPIEPPDQIEESAIGEAVVADPVVELASVVLAELGRPVPIEDQHLAETLAAAGLAEIVDGCLIGFAEEAPTWSRLAAGTLSLKELTSQ